jgi:hypothetical protein
MNKLNIEFQNENQNQFPLPEFENEHERVVTLYDGRRGLRGCLAVRVTEPSEQERRLQAAGDYPARTCIQPPEGSVPQDSLPILDFTASDETLDRYSEIIRASGWKLDHYLRNPVFQNSHQYGDVVFTLGKALETRVVEGSLRQRIQFATDVNPMARIAYGLYKGGFLNAVSVGFIPIRWEDSPANSKENGARMSRDEPSELVGTRSTASVTSPSIVGPGGTRPYRLRCETLDLRSEAHPPPHRHGGENSPHAFAHWTPKPRPIGATLSHRMGEGLGVRVPSGAGLPSEVLLTKEGVRAPRRIFLEQELLEVSAVSIPANPNALVMGIRSGAVAESDVRDLLGVFKTAIEVRSPKDEVRTHFDKHAVRTPPLALPICALGVPGDEARARMWLLRAVNGLAEVMRKAKTNQ